MEARIYTTTSTREENQDAGLIIVNQNNITVAKDEFEAEVNVEEVEDMLALICDGLGGHMNGKAAAEFVCDGLKEQYSKDDSPSALLHKINKYMINNRAEYGLTTIAGLHYSSKSKRVTIYNAGDSRVYGYSKDQRKFLQLTRDDSTAPLLMRCYGISEIEAHQQGRLTNCLGQKFFQLRESEVSMDVENFNMFLLLSDGAYLSLSREDWVKLEGMASEDQIDNALDLIKNAIKERAEDNATVIVIMTN